MKKWFQQERGKPTHFQIEQTFYGISISSKFFHGRMNKYYLLTRLKGQLSMSSQRAHQDRIIINHKVIKY